MENQFKNLTNLDINLLVAKEEMKFQPFIKYLPQRNIFGGDFSEEDELTFADDSLYIITESGREQKINFCSLTGQWIDLLAKEKINLNWYEDIGGNCCTDTSFFVDFSGDFDHPRAVAICYLISKGLLGAE
ncbi:hypothetical protein VPBG_00103 [Vibrio phage helene 12B3]|uniref:hypothetical protein n=1 Tax=Vibrio phage helene 12B3 TaxID=573173 RepID=UPI0002C0C173|nr:hypothetical protein VPBG_00103 [Vibrio phage helene 12B3]AGG57875.1 hypothetical protein VPBG_00103 [Vibrio phage helene 12B3]